MLRKAVSGIAWVGRTASMVFGLALVLGLLFGVATIALGATGGNFILGKPNTSRAITRLTATVAGPALKLVNTSKNSAATALDLDVAGGKPPMKVNSKTKVVNLNSDHLDGKNSTDLVPGGRVPAGTTIRGSYVMGNSAAEAGRQAGSDSISFGYQLPSKPHPVFIPAGAASTQQCPGTSNSPQAQPGFLCVYEDTGFNAFPGFPSIDSVTTVGAGIFLVAQDAGATQSLGTWAVKVPTAAQANRLPSPKKDGTSDAHLARPRRR